MRNLSLEAVANALVKAANDQSVQPGMGWKHDAPGAPATTGYMHGPGGLLSYPGVDVTVHQTIIDVLPGVINRVPWMPTVYTDPLFEVITGVTAGSGDEAVEECDPAPIGGTFKAGMLTAPLGRYQRQTREIQVNRLGQRNDRADPVDLQLIGGQGRNTVFGELGDTSVPNSVLVNEWMTVMKERAIAFNRLLNQQIWVGNPANTPNRNGGHVEMVGLDLLVNNNHVDAINNTPLPSVNSQVYNWNYQSIDTFADQLVNQLTYQMRDLRSRATRMHVDPVRWEIYMREELFYEITRIWPCAYMTALCNFSSSNEILNLESSALIAMRDDMREGRYLLIDGIRYTVVFDDGIPEASNTTNANVPNGSFASDIFILPMSILGGTAVLYGEYFDYSNPSISSMLATGLPLIRVFGPFIETLTQLRWCLQFQAKIEPRMILRTPWLAGRLNNVVYKPLIHTRQPFPSDPYFVDGGNTSRPGPSYYTPWAA